MINAIYRTFDFSHCLSVLVRAVKCAQLKAAPTSCQSNQHAFHRCISWPLESVSHCHHSPTGTIILDTKERNKKKGDGGILKYTKSYAPSLVNSKQMMLTLLFTASRLWAQIHQVFCISGFALFPPEENSIRADLWVCINDNPPLLPPHIGEGTHQRISNAPLCLFINNI